LGEIEEIRKILKDHEKRLENLESSKKKQKTKVEVVKKKSKTRRDLIAELIAEGFFKQPKPIGEIADKLTELNYFTKTTDLTRPLEKLVRDMLLRRFRQKGEWVYIATGRTQNGD
jgi:hypothetical protein